MQQCQCKHDPNWLKAEIGAGRYVQKFRVLDGEYVLVCLCCGGLWDHRATNRLIDLIMSDARNQPLPSAQAAGREGDIRTAPNEAGAACVNDLPGAPSAGRTRPDHPVRPRK
jgi:hypothetical protein